MLCDLSLNITRTKILPFLCKHVHPDIEDLYSSPSGCRRFIPVCKGWQIRSLESPLHFSLLDALTGSGERVTLTVIHHVSKYVIPDGLSWLNQLFSGRQEIPKGTWVSTYSYIIFQKAFLHPPPFYHLDCSFVWITQNISYINCALHMVTNVFYLSTCWDTLNVISSFK